MTADFLGQNLRLARLFHGFSLQDVADRVNKSKQYLSRLESDLESPHESLEHSLADALGVLPLFFRTVDPTPISDEQCHFRKQLTTKPGLKQVARAQGEMFKRLVSVFDQNLDFPSYGFLHEDVSTTEEIECSAEKSRAHWGLGLGPIASMSRVAESAGAVLVKSNRLADEIDAISFATRRPVITLNANGRSACRTRFGIAHEIAHLTIHVGTQTGDRSTESQANRFASAFLMPRAFFIKECHRALRGSRLNWAVLSDIKRRWGVSKAAILYRGWQLGAFSEEQYRSGVINLRRHGEAIHEREDGDIEHEKPELISDGMSILFQECHMGREVIAAQMLVMPRVVDFLLGNEESYAHIKNSNVIELHDFRSKR